MTVWLVLSICSGWLSCCGRGSLTETRKRTTHPLTDIRLCLYCVPRGVLHEYHLSSRARYTTDRALVSRYAQSSLNYATHLYFCCQRENHRHEVAAGNRTKGLSQCERLFCYTLSLCMRLHVACLLNAEWAGLQRLHTLFILSAVVAPARGALSLRLAALCSRVRRCQPQEQLVSGPTPTTNSYSLGVWVCYHIWRCTVLN